jgi:hypothetical protein
MLGSRLSLDRLAEWIEQRSHIAMPALDGMHFRQFGKGGGQAERIEAIEPQFFVETLRRIADGALMLPSAKNSA